jgi:hypothetical protein
VNSDNLNGLDAPGIGTYTDQFPLTDVAPSIHDHVASRAGLRIIAVRAEIHGAEIRHLVDDCAAVAFCVEELARHDSGLIVVNKSYDFDSQFRNLRSHDIIPASIA